MHRSRVLGACAVLGALIPLAAATPTHAAATKSYTSTSCGYSLRYPASWQLVPEKGDTLFGQPKYNVRVSCARNATVANWLRVVRPRLSKDGFHVLSSKTSSNVAILDVTYHAEADRFVATAHSGTLYVFHYAATSKALFNAHVGQFKALVDSVTFK